MKKTAVLLLATALTGCLQSGTVPDVDVESVYFETIGSGVSAAITDTTEVVIRTAEAWAELRDRLRPRAAFAENDFEQTMILIAAIPASTGGVIVEFDTIEIIGGETVATYTITEPGYDCVAIMALTQPFHVIAARRVDGPVRFVRRSTTELCSS